MAWGRFVSANTMTPVTRVPVVPGPDGLPAGYTGGAGLTAYPCGFRVNTSNEAIEFERVTGTRTGLLAWRQEDVPAGFAIGNEDAVDITDAMTGASLGRWKVQGAAYSAANRGRLMVVNVERQTGDPGGS